MHTYYVVRPFLLRYTAPSSASAPAPPPSVPSGPSPAARVPALPELATDPEAPAPDDDARLRARQLLFPVMNGDPRAITDTFNQSRAGERVHEALDILAPRGTPVLAVDDGRLVKLFRSDRGGLTVYQFDPTESFSYYYAHLDRYAPGLQEGQVLRKGDVIGEVGATGNALADAPHLHFAIFKLHAGKRWWEGTPINPYPVWRAS